MGDVAMSVALAQSKLDCCRDSKAVRSKSEPELRRGGHRRKSSSRSARQELKFDTGDLKELILDSRLVPTGHVQPSSVYHEHEGDASTTVPSSTEPSPSLMCLESDLWPSLQHVEAAEAGWDLCSEASDLDVLPDPALPLDEDDLRQTHHGTLSLGSSEDKWWLLGEHDGGVDDAEEANELHARPSFADILKCGKVPQCPPTRAPPILHSSRDVEQHVRAPCHEDELSFDRGLLDIPRRHGWTSHHKACWNAKQQRKMANSKATRATQSCKNRGWLD